VAVHTILFLELYLNRNNPFPPSREESTRTYTPPFSLIFLKFFVFVLLQVIIILIIIKGLTLFGGCVRADLMYHIDQNLMQLVQADRYATLRSASRTLRPLRQVLTGVLSVRVRVVCRVCSYHMAHTDCLPCVTLGE
jgi:hypothetical protein